MCLSPLPKCQPLENLIPEIFFKVVSLFYLKGFVASKNFQILVYKNIGNLWRCHREELSTIVDCCNCEGVDLQCANLCPA